MSIVHAKPSGNDINDITKLLGDEQAKFGKTHKNVYFELSSEHPVDLTRYQVVNCYMGRC